MDLAQSKKVKVTSIDKIKMFFKPAQLSSVYGFQNYTTNENNFKYHLMYTLHKSKHVLL
jgi:hypothetical protein